MSIIKAMRKTTKFTTSEQVIVDYILNNPERMITLTAKELALTTYTSTATVTRMCKKLNTSGFSEFKRKFIQDLKSEQYTDLTPILKKEDSTYTTINKMTLQKIMSLQDMSDNLDLVQLDRIVQNISKAKQVDVYASSGHMYIAKEFVFLLRTIGINAQINTSTNQRYAQAIMATPDHVAILINRSGETKKYIDICQTLRNKGVFCICLSNNPYSKLCLLSHDVITIKTQSLSRSIGNIIFNYNLKNFFDYIFALLYTKNDESFEKENEERVSFIHEFETSFQNLN